MALLNSKTFTYQQLAKVIDTGANRCGATTTAAILDEFRSMKESLTRRAAGPDLTSRND